MPCLLEISAIVIYIIKNILMFFMRSCIMLKNIKFFVIALAAVILFSGCRSVQVVDETEKENDAAIKTAESFLKAICAGDAETAYALLPAQAAKHYSTDKFKANTKEINGSFGKIGNSHRCPIRQSDFSKKRNRQNDYGKYNQDYDRNMRHRGRRP